MAHCPRCGLRLPYFTSRRKRREGATGPAFTLGKDCPVCGHQTRREHSPLYLRPLRLLMRSRFTYRRCDSCGWTGGCFHAPSEPMARRRAHGHRRRHAAPEAPGD
jgi:rRNA maturation protein Nop10